MLLYCCGLAHCMAFGLIGLISRHLNEKTRMSLFLDAKTIVRKGCVHVVLRDAQT